MGSLLHGSPSVHSDLPSDADYAAYLAWLAERGEWHDLGPLGCGYSDLDETLDHEAELEEQAKAIDRYLAGHGYAGDERPDEWWRWNGHPS